MPNLANFPDTVLEIPNFRPRRVSEQDRILIGDRDATGAPLETEVVFGQTLRDVVEIYVFDELGDIVGHTNIRPDDPALRLIAFISNQQVGVGQDETPDVLQVDLVNVLKRLGPSNPETGEPEGLPPGRYDITMNILRDEVGQEAGGIDRKLFISDISPSRTEVRLRPAFSNERIVDEINEFIEPSVPRFVAQAIVDQTFGISIQETAVPGVETINLNLFETEIAELDEQAGKTGELTTANRLQRSGLGPSFYTAFDASLSRIRDRVLDELARDVKDLQIQDQELQQFIRRGVALALIEMVSAGEIDARIQVLNRDGVPITPTSTRTTGA